MNPVITFISNKLLGDLNSLRNKYTKHQVLMKKMGQCHGGEKSVIDLFNECDTILTITKLIADFQDLKLI